MTEEEFRRQDRTMPVNGISADDMAALNEFIRLYPTWWWKIGWCNVSRDFDCAPQAHSPEMKLSTGVGSVWDNGFLIDSDSIANAIYSAMALIDDAKAATQTATSR